MKTSQLKSTLVIAAALLSTNTIAAEKQLKRDEVPKPVLEAFAKAQPNANIKEYEEETLDGKTVYEIEYEDNGVEYEYFYSPDGTLVLQGEEIKASELPAAVAEAARQAHPNAVIDEAKRKMLPDGAIARYEVEFKADGKELELEIDPSGRILQTKED